MVAGDVVMRYTSEQHFEQLAAQFGIMKEWKSGVPRASYQARRGPHGHMSVSEKQKNGQRGLTKTRISRFSGISEICGSISRILPLLCPIFGRTFVRAEAYRQVDAGSIMWERKLLAGY